MRITGQDLACGTTSYCRADKIDSRNHNEEGTPKTGIKERARPILPSHTSSLTTRLFTPAMCIHLSTTLPLYEISNMIYIPASESPLSTAFPVSGVEMFASCSLGAFWWVAFLLYFQGV